MIRRGLVAAAAVVLAALTVLPGGVAQAAPNPRSDEWWFTSWDIQNKAWPLTRGSGVTVAIVDTGVNAALPGLSGAVLPGTNLDHPGGDGRTDTDTEVGRGHGTSLAELIAGQGQDFGMVGVAPEAKILPIVATTNADVATGIRYAVDHGAKVINISEGFPDLSLQGRSCQNSTQAAIAYAAQKNVVVVASAGNEGSSSNRPQWPADCAGVLAVGAVDGKKIPWTDSQRQPYVSVAAPGIQIGSVYKGHVGWSDRRYAKSSGTSQATALASGAIALVRAKNPDLSARQVVQRVINTAIDAGPPGHDNYTGSGVMIPYRSMTQDVPANAANPPFAALDKYLTAQHQPPAAAPTSGGGKKSTSPVLAAVIAVVAFVIVAGLVVLLVTRRARRRGGPVVQEQPFPGQAPGQRPFPPGPQGYGPPQPPGGPPGRPMGPPPSFLPPEDRDRRPN